MINEQALEAAANATAISENDARDLLEAYEAALVSQPPVDGDVVPINDWEKRKLAEKMMEAHRKFKLATGPGGSVLDQGIYGPMEAALEVALAAAYPALLARIGQHDETVKSMQAWIDHHNERADRAEARLAEIDGLTL